MYKLPFSQLKTAAKYNLTGNYWPSFGMCLIVMAVSYVLSSVISFFVAFMLPASSLTSYIISGNLPSQGLTDYMAIASWSINVLLTVVSSILVLTPFYIGLYKYFINQQTGRQNINDIVHVFKTNYKNVVYIVFMQNLFILLWSFVFIIPGIIKSYQYCMIDYILAENPGIERKRAFELSKAMTKGNKFRIFLFSLSFIGWILLSLLTCGIGLLFLAPYMEAAFTQLYFERKNEIIATGFATEDEFIYNDIH